MRALLGIAALRIQHGAIAATVVALVYVLERLVTRWLEELRWVRNQRKGARRVI